jgi:CheY-like chemotaxis protein
MRLLLIEDNIDFAREVERNIMSIQDCDEVIWVRSRDSAIAKLRTESFDLIVLDRKLPSADDFLDDNVVHGWEVFQTIRTQSAGTPIWFLTGTEDSDFAADLNNEHGRTEDLHGHDTPEPMYQVFWKKRINECVHKIRIFAANRKALERIAVQMQTSTLQLKAEEIQTLRLFGRRNNGSLVDVTSLNGGLSNSRVLKVIVKTADGRVLTTAAAKIASLSETKAEARRYFTDISRLNPGGFPPLAVQITAGAGDIGGLFYGMVGAQVENLFARVAAGHAEVATVPEELRSILSPWYMAKQIERVPISQIRRRLIPDTVLHQKQGELAEFDISRLEAVVVSAAKCCQHRDMHCANVVFDARSHAMLIDFGDTGASFAAVDPVTLELSTVFHSEHSALPLGWPTEENMLEWPVVDRFTVNCQFAPFILACRQWANAEAGSPEEVIAVGYAYALRQFKYADTDKQLARALIRGCIEYFRVTGALNN